MLMEISTKLFPHAASLHEPIGSNAQIRICCSFCVYLLEQKCLPVDIRSPVVNRSRMERHTGTKAENGNVKIKENFGKKSSVGSRHIVTPGIAKYCTQYPSRVKIGLS